jgi:hypothetical protein
MSTTKRIIFGSALLLGLVRVAFVLVRLNARSSPSSSVIPMNPEAVSQREAQKGAQRAKLAELLDASEIALEDRDALDQARHDAMRVLRDLGREANAAGLRAVGYEAFELEQGLLHDARKTCSLGGSTKLDAASSALDPAARASFDDRLAVVRRHVGRTCELAMLMPPP